MQPNSTSQAPSHRLKREWKQAFLMDAVPAGILLFWRAILILAGAGFVMLFVIGGLSGYRIVGLDPRLTLFLGVLVGLGLSVYFMNTRRKQRSPSSSRPTAPRRSSHQT